MVRACLIAALIAASLPAAAKEASKPCFAVASEQNLFGVERDKFLMSCKLTAQKNCEEANKALMGVERMRKMKACMKAAGADF